MQRTPQRDHQGRAGENGTLGEHGSHVAVGRFNANSLKVPRTVPGTQFVFDNCYLFYSCLQLFAETAGRGGTSVAKSREAVEQ